MSTAQTCCLPSFTLVFHHLQRGVQILHMRNRPSLVHDHVTVMWTNFCEIRSESCVSFELVILEVKMASEDGKREDGKQ